MQVFGIGQFDRPGGKMLDNIRGLEVAKHFLVPGSILGKTGEEWGQGVIVAPCGCRLITFTTAHRDDSFLAHIFGLLHDITVVPVEACGELIFLLLKEGWHELLPPTYGRIAPGYPIPEKYREEGERMLSEARQLGQYHLDILTENLTRTIKEYKGENFVPVGKLVQTEKGLRLEKF